MFGSQAAGSAQNSSDVDLAVLGKNQVDPICLWELSTELSGVLNRSVDLIDLRAASTVMQHEIISKGSCLWQKGSQASLFEMVTFSQYWDFNHTRAGLLKDIQERGSVYGERGHD